MKTYIYGHWRGLPAREDRITNTREFFRENMWQGLGGGYDTEFSAWPEQLSADAWEERHRPITSTTMRLFR